MTEVFKNVREASRSLVTCGVDKINQVLLMLADATETNTQQILAANADDLARMDVNNPKYDRLKLTKERIHGIAEGIRNVALLPSPVGRVIGENVRPYQDKCPFWRDWYYLRGPSQCDARCVFALLEVGQCLCAERG